MIATFWSTFASAQETIRVDVLTGGIAQATVILQGRWGEPIGFEAVPLDPKTDLVERTNSAGMVRYEWRVNTFEFAYSGGAKEGLEAAAAAWAASGGPGDYVVRDHGARLHVVPTTRHVDGKTVPYRPLSEQVIDLSAVNGSLSLNELWQAARTALSEASGVVLADGQLNLSRNGRPWPIGVERYRQEGPSGEPVPLVTLGDPVGPAGEVLDEILRVGENGERWRIVWVTWGGGDMTAVLLADRVEPEDEGRFNGAPVPPEAPGPVP